MNDMSDPIFRAEAIAEKRSRVGSPAGVMGLEAWILTLFMTSVFAAACIFLVLAKYTKSETVLGQVVPAEGVEKIASLKPGVIGNVWVKSGQAVERGQALFSISYDSVLANGEQLSGKLADNSATQTRSANEQWDAKKSQIVQEQIGMRAKIEDLDRQIASNQQQRDLQAGRLALYEQTEEATRSLLAKEYASAQQLRQAEDQVLQAKQSLLQMDQNIEQARSDIVQVKSQLASSEQSQRESGAAFRLTSAQLEEGKLGQLSSTGARIVAAKDGRITDVQVRQGDLVETGQTLAIVVPKDSAASEEVVLWVPSRSIGFVQIGDHVRLMFDAFPYQTFGASTGQVVEVSTAPLNPNEVSTPIDSKEQVYKVVVALNKSHLDAYGRQWSLIPGMRLSADLILDKKSLLDFILDPLLAVKNRTGA